MIGSIFPREDEVVVTGKVAYDLIIAGKAPDNLFVNGHFNLDGSVGEKITTLPKNLRVRYNLQLSGCTLLDEIPEGLEVGDDLYLGDIPAAQDFDRLAKIKVGGLIYTKDGFAKLRYST